MTQTTLDEISNTADVLDVRDLIDALEDAEGEADGIDPDTQDADEQDLLEDLERVRNFLDELAGQGGDHEWRGAWYPAVLVRDSYWENYAMEFAEEIGAIPDDAQWPCTRIDWERAARELRIDYTCADFDGTTYWFR